MAQGKSWVPSEKERNTVEVLVAAGFSQDAIARILGINRNTLAKHCKEELEHGGNKAHAVVVNKLFQKIQEGDAASIFFWLKTRLGWREKDRDDEQKQVQPTVVVIRNAGPDDQ